MLIISDEARGLGIDLTTTESHVTVRVVEIPPKTIFPHGVDIIITLPRTPDAERLLGAALNALGEEQWNLQAALYIAAKKAKIPLFPPSQGAINGGISPPAKRDRKQPLQFPLRDELSRLRSDAADEIS